MIFARLRAFGARDAFYLAVALLATAPAWIVKHPPLQDLPTHLAILRVVHSYGDAKFNLAESFSLNLFQTQYLLYYVVGSLLAYVLGIVKANIVLICLYLGGTVLSMRALLKELGKDERLALLVVPLLVNVMFVFGFLPFLLGIPAALLGLTFAIRYFEKPTRNVGIAVGAFALFTFLTHLFPFALFGVGFAAMFPWEKPRQWLRAGAPVIPALILLGLWLSKTETAHKSMASLKSTSSVAPYDAAIRDAFHWSFNVFHDQTDELTFLALAAVAALALALAQGDKDTAKPIARRYFVLPMVCAFLYFVTGDTIGEVWLFSQRFPTLALLTGVPLLRMPRGGRGFFVTVLALMLAVGSTVNVCRHFIEFETQEVGDLDDALAQMDPGRKVAGLIYDKGSAVMSNHYAPFLHFVSYYQAEKGGVVQFSNANIRYSPFHFKDDKLPPEGQPARLRWEWTPEQVTTRELYPYYDYVLTRGSGFQPPPGTYRVKWRGDRWTVWEKS